MPIIGWNRAIESKNLVVIMIVSSSGTNQINVNKTFCQATMVTLYDNMVWHVHTVFNMSYDSYVLVGAWACKRAVPPVRAQWTPKSSRCAARRSANESACSVTRIYHGIKAKAGWQQEATLQACKPFLDSRHHQLLAREKVPHFVCRPRQLRRHEPKRGRHLRELSRVWEYPWQYLRYSILILS